MTSVIVRDLGKREEGRCHARPEPLRAPQLERLLEATPSVRVTAGRLPGEREMPDCVRREEVAAVVVAGSVSRPEMREGGRVVVPDHLPDDPDPEPCPTDEQRVAGAPCRREGRLEMRELARILSIAAAQEPRVEDPAALGLQAGLDAIELAAGGSPRIGGPREERLFVEQVCAEQRIVAGELDGLVPAALPAESRDPISSRHATSVPAGDRAEGRLGRATLAGV